METFYTAKAIKALRKMPSKDSLALREKIRTYASEPSRPHPWVKPLIGTQGLRIRHGDWRAICVSETDMTILNVVKIGHRREIYR